jgi:hypothetical protein
MLVGLRLLLGFSVPPKWFEKLYVGGRDPWNYASSEYELQKMGIPFTPL